MKDRTPLVAGAVIVTLAAAAATLFESVYDLSFDRRAPDPLLHARAGIDRHDLREPLPLRLVDSGGVGIPVADSWGADYSHARRVFHDVILNEAPYVDDSAFQRVEHEWRTYVERMLDYGNNAIAVPLLLELIDFDRIGDSTHATGAVPVYAVDSPFRRRHDAVRRRFGPLFEWTARRGMQVFLDADMLTLTPPLSRHLRSVAPDRRAPGINPHDPAVWDVYRAGLEELFDTMPWVQGLVIRFGEGGDLYNTAGWPYRSEMTIRSAAALQALLRGLLPLFEARQKTLILRSWTVGVGALGRLHVDPAAYESILGPIDSPALVVSTKFTAGDFFSYLPLNPTLAAGRHRRIVELQAKPEFEGFGAFPNFLGGEHALSLGARDANPNIVGTYVLTQFGGPLRAGPRMLYPFHGFWLWTDVNVYVASRLASVPDANVDDVVRQWARLRISEDERIVDAVADVLRETRRAVLEGFYIRPFAERRVRVPGLEVPPLMWIFEWDMVGGWHSLLSIVYRGSRDDVTRAIAEGHEAVAVVRNAHRRLKAAVDAAGSAACGDTCSRALRSLEYQETLFDALADWRQAFLSYYRWVDTGDAEAWSAWQSGRIRFDEAAGRHVERFGADQEFPAFDLASARRAITFVERATAARVLAGAVLAGAILVLAIGGGTGTRPTPLTACLLTLVMLVAAIATLTSFSSARLALGASLPFAAAALAFASTTRGSADRDAVLVASLAPSLAGLAVILGLIAFLGPIGFWYSFWVIPLFRVVLVITLVGSLIWTSWVMLAGRRDHWLVRAGGPLAAAGAGLATLALLSPDWVSVLRYLDRPLNLAPATDTMLFALRTYAGVSLAAGRAALLISGLLLTTGYGLWLFAALGGRRR